LPSCSPVIEYPGSQHCSALPPRRVHLDTISAIAGVGELSAQLMGPLASSIGLDVECDITNHPWIAEPTKIQWQ
jgi:hypothetical protein